jgi:hypothetical protein
VKANKILKDAVTEEQLYKAVQKAYEDAGEAPERILENGQLLWLRRFTEQMWELPSEA